MRLGFWGSGFGVCRVGAEYRVWCLLAAGFEGLMGFRVKGV